MIEVLYYKDGKQCSEYFPNEKEKEAIEFANSVNGNSFFDVTVLKDLKVIKTIGGTRHEKDK